MANVTITSPNGSTTFSIDASWVTRLLDYAAAVDPALDAAGKEAWIRKRMFISLRNDLQAFERSRDAQAARDAVDEMPIVEV